MIELAAARTVSMTAVDVRDRVGDRSACWPVRAAGWYGIGRCARRSQWSFDLLDAPERTVAVPISVSAGGFDTAAAVAVCGGDQDDDACWTCSTEADAPLTSEEPSVASRRNASMSTLTDGELVLRCRAGDERAWAELVNRHTRLLHAIARSCGLGAAAADDVVQTTWTRLFTSLDALRAVESVRAWLATTARREAIRTRRRGSGPLLFEGDVDPTAVDEGVLAQERARAIRRAVHGLSESERRLIELLFDGLPRSYAEVASMVSRPIGSIGPTRGRLLRRLGCVLRTEYSDAA